MIISDVVKGIHMTRTCVSHSSEDIRTTYILRLGKLLILIYIALNNEELELDGLIQVESTRGKQFDIFVFKYKFIRFSVLAQMQ